ncbi:hypothetical protein [Rhodanobacter sp. OR87]|uniref:hypothetical protein n=1 Tax=Rhodanobacter sp. OR87 TaxID=1076523 RepID=UPI0012DE2D3E|nr:hypothetical protein [Rhodanobacter sp. OR87]
MKYFAALYSIAFGGAASWAWICYFLYKSSAEEHLLPGIVLNIVALPSSLLMEKIIESTPWLLNSAITMLALVTALGFLQVILVWLFVYRGVIGRILNP